MTKLYNIRKHIYNLHTREECLKNCILYKLEISYINYKDNLLFIFDNLCDSNTKRVLNNIVKLQNKE